MARHTNDSDEEAEFDDAPQPPKPAKKELEEPPMPAAKQETADVLPAQGDKGGAKLMYKAIKTDGDAIMSQKPCSAGKRDGGSSSSSAAGAASTDMTKIPRKESSKHEGAASSGKANGKVDGKAAGKSAGKADINGKVAAAAAGDKPAKSTAAAAAAADAAAAASLAKDSDDDDMPLAQLKKRKKEAAAAAVAAAADSDEDVPLSKVKLAADKDKKAKAAAASGSSGMKRKSASAADSDDVGSSSRAAKKPAAGASSSSGPARKRARDDLGPTTASDALADTTKGQLVRKLLCRWWYAMAWPRWEDVTPSPPGHEALDGYPGVYVCVDGDHIGEILDNRDQSTCPCFTNFARMGAAELRRLLKTALETQREKLVEHWGEGTRPAQERAIRQELKWLRSVEAAAADKEARKALGKAGISEL